MNRTLDLLLPCCCCAYYRPDDKTDRAATARLDTAAGRPRSGHTLESAAKKEKKRKEKKKTTRREVREENQGGTPRAQSSSSSLPLRTRLLCFFFFHFPYCSTLWLRREADCLGAFRRSFWGAFFCNSHVSRPFPLVVSPFCIT